MGLARCVRPGRIYFYCIHRDSRRRMLGRAPAIHRSIWSSLLYFLSHATGHVCIPELLCFFLFGEVVPAGAQAELPFYLGRAVVGQPYYALVVPAPVPRHQIEVAICASGNFLLGVRVRIPRLPGPQSIYQ